MDPELTAKEVTELAEAITRLAEKLSAKIDAQRAQNPPGYFDEQDKLVRGLVKISRELTAVAVGLRMKMLQGSLDTLKEGTRKLKEAADKIAQIKEMVVIATKVLAIGGEIAAAIAAPNPATIGAAALSLFDLFSPGGTAAKPAQ